MLSEPRLVRRARPGKQLIPFLPVCGRCGKLLRGKQTRWCGHGCRRNAAYWVGQLAAYWEKAG